MKQKRKRTAAKGKRIRLDAKLAALPPQQQIHQLFYGRPIDGGALEQLVRDWWAIKQMRGERDKPYMRTDRGASLVNGKPVAVYSMIEGLERLSEDARQRTAVHVAACVAAAFSNWKPDFFERIAELMRKVEGETTEPFNPSKTQLDRDYRLLLRAAKQPVNLSEVARLIVGRSFAGTPAPKDKTARDKMESLRTRRMNSTLRTLGRIARRSHILTLPPGRPPKSDS